MIKIKLSSAAMGDVTEADFDAWAAYVLDHIEEETGIEIAEIDQFAFGHAGDDEISGADDDDERAAIRTWLAVIGWEAFCADESAWPKAA